jgi:16S rRNA G966 N2-methylase RsmD
VLAVLDGLEPVDVAFCDPPYADDPWADLLGRLRADLVVGHAEHPIELPSGWDEVRRRDYGRSRIVIARRSPSAAADGAEGP